VLLWGFSQGGHAVLAAAELAGQLAPDADLRGVAAAAPVSDVTAFLERSMQPTQLGVALSILRGAVLAAPELVADEVLTDEGYEVFARLDRLCIAEAVIEAESAVEAIIEHDPTQVVTWREVTDAQRVGDRTSDAPVLLLQGAADQIIPAADTRALQQRLCRLGVAVQLVERHGEDHAVTPQPDLVRWFAARLAGDPPPSTC
jgi:alpha-beta hydrolase superfamily lysophospholipase